MCVLRCGRCGNPSYEQLNSHGYCVDCNYSEDLASDDEAVATLAWACKVVDELEAKERSKVIALPLSQKSPEENFSICETKESRGAL